MNNKQLKLRLRTEQRITRICSKKSYNHSYIHWLLSISNNHDVSIKVLCVLIRAADYDANLVMYALNARYKYKPLGPFELSVDLKVEHPKGYRPRERFYMVEPCIGS